VAPVRILLAEDSSDNRMLMEAFLKGGGYRIDEAENGEVAIAKYQAGKYDLVLMDIQMPVVDGYSAVRAIRQWEAERKLPRTPIIALTASAMQEAVQRSLQVGCDSHVSKPVKRATLLEAIREVLGAGTAGHGNGASAAHAVSSDNGIKVEVDGELRDLIPDYLTHKRADAAAARAAADRGDFATIAKLGHQMKGDGGSYGFARVSEIGVALMDAARREDRDGARNLADALSDYLARVEVVFRFNGANP